MPCSPPSTMPCGARRAPRKTSECVGHEILSFGSHGSGLGGFRSITDHCSSVMSSGSGLRDTLAVTFPFKGEPSKANLRSATKNGQTFCTPPAPPSARLDAVMKAKIGALAGSPGKAFWAF